MTASLDPGPGEGEEDRQRRRQLRQQAIAEGAPSPPHPPLREEKEIQADSGEKVSRQTVPTRRGRRARGSDDGRNREEKEGRENEEPARRAEEQSCQPRQGVAPEVVRGDRLRRGEGRSQVNGRVPGVEETRDRGEGGETKKRPPFVTRGVESERERDRDVGRPADDGESQGEARPGHGAASSHERPESGREKADPRRVLEHAAAGDAPDGRPEGIDQRKAERHSTPAADPRQGEIQKQNRQRREDRRGDAGEKLTVRFRIHTEKLGHRVDRNVQETGKHRVGRDDASLGNPKPKPVGQRFSRRNELPEVEAVPVEESDRKQLRRAGVSPSRKPEPEEVDVERNEEGYPGREHRQGERPPPHRRRRRASFRRNIHAACADDTDPRVLPRKKRE